MQNNQVLLLGISVDNLTMDAFIAKMMLLIESSTKDSPPKYITILELNHLVNSLNWHWGKPKHPEFLKILRSSHIITGSGNSLMWLSKLLRSPLKEKISGPNLLPVLLEALAKESKAIYFVGGKPQTIKIASILIEALHPGITIAGIATPEIYIQGDKLSQSHEEDGQLADQINASSADVLFISLDSPQQEIWFNRIKQQLKVPLSIGIGNTLEVAFGPIGRAPFWMQKTGMEWCYHLINEPRRIWNRYILGGSKFLIQILPLLSYHWISKGISWIRPHHRIQPEDLQAPQLFISKNLSIAALDLPPVMGYNIYRKLAAYLEETKSQDALIIDFRKLKFLSPKQLSRLVNLWTIACDENKQLFAYGISKPLKFYLKLHRIWDLFDPYFISTPEKILARLPLKDSKNLFFNSLRQHDNIAIAGFLGTLNNEIDYNNLLEKLMPVFNGKKCLLDLTYCTSIENDGFSFLLDMHNSLLDESKPLTVLGASTEIKHQFGIAKIGYYFKFLSK